MINGIYQSDSIITHRTIGVLHLYNFSTIIETKYSKEWCYELISIINQHHDKYGEGIIISMDSKILTVAFPHPHGIQKLIKGHISIRKVD